MGQGSPKLISDYGAQRPRCIGTIRVGNPMPVKPFGFVKHNPYFKILIQLVFDGFHPVVKQNKLKKDKRYSLVTPNQYRRHKSEEQKQHFILR
jgi:hypothetical protein